ncbi:unnamed protein product [Paramecium primaurelia]|uniref:Uncharacterized protein n=1 Tax=Paramecium primaurelia TaxID=5886 RepID=A0A8S1MEG9_PARPR|nr:unnamed protein product [Paramecium primaurelia]
MTNLQLIKNKTDAQIGVQEALQVLEYLNKILLIISQIVIHLNQFKRKLHVLLKNLKYIAIFLKKLTLKYCCLWLNPNKQKRVNRGVTLSGILESLEVKEIQSSWELTDGFHLNKAKVKFLQVENERKQIYADTLATKIKDHSQNALEQTQADLEDKRANYSEVKSNRDDENAIIEYVIIVQEISCFLVWKLISITNKVISKKTAFWGFKIIFLFIYQCIRIKQEELRQI